MAEDKKKKYVSDYAHLMEEWDWEKNGEAGLNPEILSQGCHQEAWWKCSHGHSWNSIISNRIRLNRGCPYCAGQRPIVGATDLCTTHPSLAKEWNYAKNEELLPEQCMGGSHKIVWWICSEGHEWKAQIKSRANGVGCPYCANKLVYRGYNDLATTHPELAAEWHPTKNENLTPQDITFGSGKKVWWQCKNNHEWEASVDNRTKGRGCPVCSSRRRTSFPEQAIYYYIKKAFPDAQNGYKEIFNQTSMELDIYIPTIKVGIEYDGRRYHSQTSNRIRDSRKYKICREQGIMLIRITDNMRAEIIINCDRRIAIPEANDFYLTSAISQLLYKLGKPMNVNIAKDRLDILSYLSTTDVSLESTFPEIAKEWNYEKNKELLPSMFHPGSNEKVWWICSVCGQEWKTSLAERTGRDKTNCPRCARMKGAEKRRETLIERHGSVAEVAPQLVAEWDYEKNDITPEIVSASSSKRVWWKCKVCDYNWETTIDQRVSRNSGCPCCKNRVVVAGKNDLATTHPHLLEEWNYEKNTVLPKEVTAGSGKKVWWKCSVCGNEWNSVIHTKANGSGCPVCAKKKRTRKIPIETETDEQIY